MCLAALVAACGGAATPPASAPPSVAVTPTTPSAVTTTACDATVKMPDLGRDHITSLTYSYPQHPATSGPHYGIWIMPPPQVFSNPLQEVKAVHNLEHGYVVVYYSAGPESRLPQPVVSALAAKVNGQRKVLMAPYQPLPAGRALAFAAWDELQLCGSAVSAEEASAALDRFIADFREGPLAPEPHAG